MERKWPETYDFPACVPCNKEARLDEQALAVLVRVKLPEDDKEPDRSEFAKLIDGVKNNQPALVKEWLNLSRNQQKRSLREMFDEVGDHARREGWGAIHLGPLSHAAIERFMVKLGKALYYRHIGQLLDGFVYYQHVNPLSKKSIPGFIETVLSIAPEVALPQRGNKPLAEQFFYRFNHSPEHGIIHSVVRFNSQFVFIVVALSRDMHHKLVKFRMERGEPLLTQGVVDASLKHRPLD